MSKCGQKRGNIFKLQAHKTVRIASSVETGIAVTESPKIPDKFLLERRQRHRNPLLISPKLLKMHLLQL